MVLCGLADVCAVRLVRHVVESIETLVLLLAVVSQYVILPDVLAPIQLLHCTGVLLHDHCNYHHYYLL